MSVRLIIQRKERARNRKISADDSTDPSSSTGWTEVIMSRAKRGGGSVTSIHSDEDTVKVSNSSRKESLASTSKKSSNPTVNSLRSIPESDSSDSDDMMVDVDIESLHAEQKKDDKWFDFFDMMLEGSGNDGNGTRPDDWSEVS